MVPLGCLVLSFHRTVWITLICSLIYGLAQNLLEHLYHLLILNLFCILHCRVILARIVLFERPPQPIVCMGHLLNGFEIAAQCHQLVSLLLYYLGQLNSRSLILVLIDLLNCGFQIDIGDHCFRFQTLTILERTPVFLLLYLIDGLICSHVLLRKLACCLHRAFLITIISLNFSIVDIFLVL